VGEAATSAVQTPSLVIKRLFLERNSIQNLVLDKNCSYTFYMLKGHGKMEGYDLQENDAVRISNEELMKIEFENEGELFFIQTPLEPGYRTIWN